MAQLAIKASKCGKDLVGFVELVFIDFNIEKIFNCGVNMYLSDTDYNL